MSLSAGHFCVGPAMTLEQNRTVRKAIAKACMCDLGRHLHDALVVSFVGVVTPGEASANTVAAPP